MIITGYVPDLLQSITMVGDAGEINGLGMCGKGHKEWVKVTDGGPFLKFKARLAEKTGERYEVRGERKDRFILDPLTLDLFSCFETSAQAGM